MFKRFRFWLRWKISNLWLDVGRFALSKVHAGHFSTCPCGNCTMERSRLTAHNAQHHPLRHLEHMALVLLCNVHAAVRSRQGEDPHVDAETWEGIVDSVNQIKARLRGNRAAELGVEDSGRLIEALVREAYERLEHQPVEREA